MTIWQMVLINSVQKTICLMHIPHGYNNLFAKTARKTHKVYIESLVNIIL